MITSLKIEIFLAKYLASKNVSFLELFIYEYYKLKSESSEVISRLKENEKFFVLARQISYHLLELLFSTISELTNKNDVLFLRNFLTSGLGGKILNLLSDLHMCSVTNERELVNVLTKVFPNDYWEGASELSMSRLSALSHDDVKNTFSRDFRLLKQSSLTRLNGSCENAQKISVDEENIVVDEYLNDDDFKAFNESFYISSVELADRIIKIFSKLLEAKKESTTIDRSYLTINCLNFCFDTLIRLNERQIFNESDQTVIKIRITQLICQCFNSLVQRDGNEMKVHIRRVYSILESSLYEVEVTYGLIMCIISTLGNLCIRKSSQSHENIEILKLCNHLVLKQMELLSESDDDFLFIVQKRLLEIMTILSEAPQNVGSQKKSKNIKSCHRHHSQMDACIFERILIDSFAFVRCFKQLKLILSHLKAKGICCCNGNYQTISIFMRSSTIASHFLNFIENRIVLVMFEKSKICIYCNEKINAEEFSNNYFALLKSELKRRQGYELYALLNHLGNIQKLLIKEFRIEFIFKVLVPVFEDEKINYLRDVENNQESRLIACNCLKIIAENSNDDDVLKRFLTTDRINQLCDCSLIPAISLNACIILSNGLKVLDNQELITQIKSIFFANIHYLIKELTTAIYDQIELPKCDLESANENVDFEILDQQMVVVKENLSNLDILLLNSIHWNILSELIVQFPLFQNDFILNINHHENILFRIACNALNILLLKRERQSFSPFKKNCNHSKEMDLSKQLDIYCLVNHPNSIICTSLDLNYEQLMRRSFDLFEICPNFSDKLRSEADEIGCCIIYRSRGTDKERFINLAVHRDNFLPDSLSFSDEFKPALRESSYHHQQHWINSFRVGTAFLDSSRSIRDAFIKVLNRLIRPDEEMKAMHRKNLLNEITGKFGIKYLSGIARNCFDISFRLSSQNFGTKMSTALDELKLLLVQANDWNSDSENSKKVIVDALHLLLGVAEMKTRGVNRLMFLNSENHIEGTTESIFSELNASSEGGNMLSYDGSEEDMCDNKITEAYYTADENYDADEEYFSMRGDDTICSQSFKTPSTCSTFQDVKISNEHICRLVVEILMDVSKSCIDSNENLDDLIPLAQRLSCMKSYLGGSEFLLKGFSPILTKNLPLYRAFQHAVLELIDEINTPEILRTFFSILTEENAPTELIVSRMEALCKKDLTSKPFCAVKYPIVSSEPVVTSSCDTYVHGLIQSLKNINRSRSPFVEASQIIPLNFFELKLWTSNIGYTLSTWVEPEYCENLSTIHLLSIGSEKMMLAIFINSDGTFDFVAIKPSCNSSLTHHHRSKIKVSKSLDLRPNTSSSDQQNSDKENVNKSNILGIASAILRDREMPSSIRTRGSLKNGSKKSSKNEENYKQMETSRVLVKSKKSKLKYHHWTHLCLALRSNETQISILLTLNGTEHENIEIPIDGMNNNSGKSDMNGEFQLLFIGANKAEKTAEKVNEMSYCMSNVTFFKTAFDAYLVAYLYALGPNCSNFSDCEIKNIMPIRGTLDLTKLITRISLRMSSIELLRMLKSNILLTYAVGKSNYATGYLKSDYGKPLEIFTNGLAPTAHPLKSIARAVYFTGGLSSLLFLFARTVELSEDSVTQSTALFIFLKMAFSNNYLYAEFEQKKLFNLVAHVFKNENCYRGPGMLKAVLDVIFNGTMFNKKSHADEYQINERSELNIQNPSLLMTLLSNFNIFQLPDRTDASNLNLLFKSLKVATRESHPYKHINRQYLIEHGFYERILEFCKIHLTSNSNAMTLPTSTAITLVELLKMLSRNPPIYVTMKIQELLILLHHPSESFITHDRSKFNFILSSQKPTKVNRNSTITSKFSFNFSTKIRSTNTISVPQSPTSSQRSNSTDSSSPRTPTLLTNADMNLVFSEFDGGTLKSFKGSTDSAAASSTSTSRKIKSQKFDELSEIQAKRVTKAFVDLKSNKGIKTPTKVFSKRLQSTPKKSPFASKHATPSKRKLIETDCEDEFDQKLIEAFDSLMSKSNLYTSDNNLNRYEKGVSVLQEHLFVMLKEALLSVDDNQIQMEVAECMRIESFIMFANHPDGNVRAAIIELIYTIVTRQSQEMINFYQKSNYWTHLGNQLSIASSNHRIIQTCVNWIFMNEKEINFDEIIRLQKDDVKFKGAIRILITLIPSTSNDAKLMKSLVKFLRLLMEINADCFITMIEYGLVTACLRTLMKVDDDDMIESLQVILEEIATKSFTTSNAINGLWELLYGLVYAERHGISPNSVRDIHLTILRQLFSLCLMEQNRRGSRSNESFQLSMVIKKSLGNLPSSEIKTRFNMIHDRALQFLYSWEKFEDLKTFEIDFVKYLIDLYFCGVHQGSALLLWALNPTCCEEIQLFVTHKIIAALTIDSNFSVSEPKMLKALLHHLFTSSSQFFSEDQQRIIIKFCGTTLNQQQQNFNWVSTAIEKIDIMNQNAQKEQYQQVEKIIFKHETLVHAVIDGAMRITRDVIDIQNRERRQLMNYLKRTQEIDYYREWHELIERMTHENAPWYNAELYPTTFELDETEGPGRIRIRMKRTALKIDDKFFMNEFKHKAKYQHRKQLLDYLLHPKETERYSINDQIIFTFNGKHLTLEQEIEGEIIVTDNQFNFLANINTYNNSIICDINEIDEIWDRRYQHKEIAIEIFLKCSKNFFLIFETKYERDIVTKFLTDKTNMKEGSQRVESITQRWIENKMTNYEYLTELNKISGRSYNDLMQYPVFPWILTDYSSDVLDLTIAESYRKLKKTISTQYEDNEEHYVSNYNYLVQQSNDYQSILKPYHYSSHYSNSGTVLHFLVRMPPFTNMFLLYQDHNFDIPDRTFHSLATTYRLTSRESATDVKELIPEFFHLPDFLINNEGFNYGTRQSGEQVNDVKLPTWCDESARLFTFIHRQALESDFVRKQLHQWIDLIFGFKQKGKAAVEAINVFHPATYPEFQIANITDHVERSAYETMVRTYGQMPKQIFISPHKKSSSNEKQDLHFVLRGVKGLKWGTFTGSPQLQKPRKITAKAPIPCKQKNPRLVAVNHRNKFFVIPNTSCLMKGTAKNSYDLVLWREIDGVVRTKSFHENKSRKLFNVPTCDPITACGADINYCNLWFGHQSGNISVYKRVDEKQKIKKRTGSNQKVLSTALESIIDIKVNEKSLNDMDDELEVVQFHWSYPITLLRHSTEVTAIKICAEFKIVVSIGDDGRAVIWDSQKVEYIRSIEPSCNTLRACLTHVDISSTLGDILTVFRPRNESCEDDCFEVVEDKSDDFINISMSIAGKSQLRLHNINAKYIGHTFIEGVVNATCFSFVKEGTGINVIAIALNDGTVKLYSTWNLDFVREIATGCSRIIEISFSTNHYLTILSDQDIHVWGSDGIVAERPSFHDIILE